MKISKRKFCIKYNIEIQWLTELINKGLVNCIVKPVGKKIRVLLDDIFPNNLIKGIHYVECPFCKKKMAAVYEKHYKICSKKRSERSALYSELFLGRKQKTEEQKKAQSNKLKNRFKTSEGEKTRRIISEASRRLNSDPEFLKRKSKISKEIQNRPENKIHRSKTSKKMWSDPKFRKRKDIYVKEHIEELRNSADNARKNLSKTSKLHKKYKESMNEEGLKGFITEYKYGYYSIDEADPFAKIAIEIDGCYWHGCSKCGFEGDLRIKLIDKKKETYLRNRGWIVIHVKEHEIKKNPQVAIESIRTLQEKRRSYFRDKIKKSFNEGNLKTRSFLKGSEESVWIPITDVMRHRTKHKNIYRIHTEKASVDVTGDHSLFLFKDKKPVKASELVVGDKIVGLGNGNKFEAFQIVEINILEPEENTYDLSVPQTENFVLKNGILAHNSYSLSGVSLDIEKSSKYESMKSNFEAEFEKSRDLAKSSIKLIRGLKQPRYGVGISSALGPYSRPGVQSRRNFASGFRGGWS